MKNRGKFSRELSRLVEIDDYPAVSIFMPTFKNAADTDQNPIRFKSLLRKARAELDPIGSDIDQNWDRAWSLAGDKHYWMHQRDGLALYFSPHHFRAIKLPFSIDERVVVARRFLVRPLFHFVTGELKFFVLALSKHGARLIRCSRYNASEVPLAGIPRSVDEMLRDEVWETQLQMHTTMPADSHRGGMAFHGNETAADREKENVRQYLLMVESAVQDQLKNENAPLVLAGVEYLLSIYDEINSYSQVVDRHLVGNPDYLDEDEIRMRALAILETAENGQAEKMIERFAQKKAAGRASGLLDEIALSVVEGKVDMLFVARGEEKWGAFYEEQGRVEEHSERQPDDVELLDFIAAKALSQRAAVYELDPSRMPDGSSIAAIYRY